MKLFPGLFYGAGGLCFCAVVSARAAIFTVTTTADNGPGSLRASIAAASSGDAIVFSSSLAGQTIQLTGGQLSIGQNLTIDASALANGIIINGGGNGRVLEIGGSGFVELDGLTLTNGYGNGGTGAGVFLDNTTCGLTANHCVFSGNFGAEYGGGIYTYGTLTLNNCIVYGNTADVFGGGIFGYGSAITLNNCRLLANLVSNGGGGGIESELTTLRLNGCVISNNFSPFFGGGLDSDDDGSLAATNCVFADNTSGTGGAISVETPATTAILSDCTFCDNISTNGAGGGMVNYGSLALINCLFSGNSVTNSNGLGGGLVNSGIATVNNCTFSGNSAVNGSGGGIYNWETLTASNCSWFGNTASENEVGGGIGNNSGIVTLYNCTISGNSANNGSGGGLASFYGTNVLINCTICGNSAIYAGGILDDASSTFALTNTIVAGNTAQDSPDIAASYSGAANFIGGNPQLAGLGNYGGNILTMPPEFGSPVIDAGTDWATNFLSSDQRGYPRLSGRHVDIGAVEAQVVPAKNRPVLRNSAIHFVGSSDISFQFSFTNQAEADFTVLTSTNLALPPDQWTIVGNVIEGLPGQFQYIQPAQPEFPGELPNYPPQQFYRVVSP